MVLAEGALVTIGRNEDQLEVRALGLEAGVELGQDRREPPARRAPVGGEVDHEVLPLQGGSRDGLFGLVHEVGAEHGRSIEGGHGLLLFVVVVCCLLWRWLLESELGAWCGGGL